MDELFSGEGSNKGWNRASITYHSRKPYKPSVKAEDLLLPSGRGSLRLLAMCAVMAVCMTILYVYLTLYLVNVFVPFGGPWYAVVLGGIAAVLTVLLYFLASHETRRDRELAATL